MLTIRRQQFAVLGASNQRAFLGQIMPHLHAEHPAWHAELGDGTWGFVERVVGLAAKHAILGRQAVLTFIELCIEFGESFERSPEGAWAQELLTHPKLPDTVKIELISERLRALTKGRRIVEHVP